MKIEDTRIKQAGVMRCCLETVALEYLESDGGTGRAEDGDTSSCDYCKTEFRLVGNVWTPVWQIEKGVG